MKIRGKENLFGWFPQRHNHSNNHLLPQRREMPMSNEEGYYVDYGTSTTFFDNNNFTNVQHD